uniref:NADH-ubiquinone oxidoreductase chain 5 n=1 Tax=Rhynchophorus ferrugineus TaxID=354439 RepID=A0A0S2A3B9_RHYFE|nr:NADH dehydrogenase subunit 5 [Rhynchophorus ferrugineus]
MMLNNIYFLIFLSFSLSLFFGGLSLSGSEVSTLSEYSLVDFNSVSIIFGVIIDWMSLLFMSFVLFISAAVIKYSEEYMGEDFHKGRFIYLVVMFVVSMMFMILSPNLVSILLGWDGLGLVSYALVIFYQNVKSFNAGLLTALTNRVGDVAILICIAFIFNFGTWNFWSLLELLKKDVFFQVCTLMIIIAAMTKSAQMPFSAWLPAAMAAPTPVSALVHSSTLVTAGVYLLIRFSDSIPFHYMDLLMYISLLTMFMSGYAANFEFDLKKIIALSTLSQLGMMIFILVAGSLELAFFHLLIHALFKALLFMCAGMIIHNFSDCQDIRYMGSLINAMPLTCVYFNICNLALCGIPFLSGFYSKDLIVEMYSYDTWNLFYYFIFFFSIGLTVSYSFRLTYYTMSGGFNGFPMNSLSEVSKGMLISMGLLIFLVIFMGSALAWMIFPTPCFIALPFFFKIFTLLMILSGIWIGYGIAQFSLNFDSKTNLFQGAVIFLVSMWNLPTLSSLLTSKWFLKLSKLYNKLVDQGWFEFYGSQKFFNSLTYVTKFIQLLSKNHIKIFILLTFIWITYAVIFM